MDSDLTDRSSHLQQPPPPAAVASLAVDHAAAAMIAEVCARDPSTMSCVWDAGSVGEAVRRMAMRPVNVLVVDHCRLGADLVPALVELHAVAPDSRTLLIGPHVDTVLVARLLPLGLRGCLPLDRLPNDLPTAIAAVARGQLWFTRLQTAELLGIHASASGSFTGDPAAHLQPLSVRELEVLHHVLQGQTNKQIAGALGISDQTVKIHLHNIYRKLGIHRRIELLVAHDNEPSAGTQQE